MSLQGQSLTSLKDCGGPEISLTIKERAAHTCRKVKKKFGTFLMCVTEKQGTAGIT